MLFAHYTLKDIGSIFPKSRKLIEQQIIYCSDVDDMDSIILLLNFDNK